MRTKNLVWIGVIAMVSIVMAPILQVADAHQRALFAINGKDYLFVIGSLNEPIFVDDKTGVEFRGIWPNSTDPTNSNANGTQPITGLENSLRVEILAGDKNMTSNLEPAYGEVGSYESEIFYTTVPTTLSYRIFGDINGTNFSATFSCTPEAEQRPSDNSTVEISENVVRKSLQGGFGCPEERVGFPEPYVSQYEISQMLNKTTTP